MKNILKTILFLAIACSIPALTGAQVGGQTIWKMLGGSIQPMLSTWTIGSATNRIAKIWATDIDSTSLTIGSVSGDIDMGGYSIKNSGGFNTLDITPGKGSNSFYFNKAGNTTGSAQANFAFGSSSLQRVTSGGYNVAIGLNNLASSTISNYNVALGINVLSSTLDDDFGGSAGNIAIGREAMRTAWCGSYNVALGYGSLRGAGNTGTCAQHNVGIGQDTLRNINASNNIAIGFEAIEGSLVTGVGNNASYSIGIGYRALQKQENGLNNIALGTSALRNRIDGNSNIGIGYNAGSSGTSSSNNLSIGNYAGAYETDSNSFYVNNRDLTDTAGDKAYSLLYGTFGTGASLTGQSLTVNVASTTIKNTATSTLIVDTSSASQGSCLKLKDIDGGGYTYVTVLDGVLSASADSCE
jgi:hypothetical protein